MNVEASSMSIPSRSSENVEFKIASTREEREAAFELTYHAYLRSGLCKGMPGGVRITPYQLLPTTDIFIAKLKGEVISTLSLVRDGEMGLPMEETYRDEVAMRRDAGLHLAEISCLADCRKGIARFFGIFCELCQLMAQFAEKMSVDQLMIAVHPRHAPVYRRSMAFTQIGDHREYAAVQGNPAVALSRDLRQLKINEPAIWARFFGQRLPDEALMGQPMSDADRNYFLALQVASEAVEMAIPLGASSEEGVDLELMALV